MEEQGHPAGRGLRPGTAVEVRNGLSTGWASGFEVATVERGGYRLRRLSDKAVLPAVFESKYIRPRQSARMTKPPWG